MKTGVKVAIGAGFCGLLAIASVGAAKLEEKKVGETCETYNSSACAGNGGACLASQAGNYCSVSCSASKDCPTGWSCEEVASRTYSGKTGKQVDEKSVRMCLRP